MHAKSAEVTQFLEQNLLPQVQAALSQYQSADKAAIEKELDGTVRRIRSDGADPDTSPKVRELRTRLAEEAVDLGALEAEVYDHLYAFSWPILVLVWNDVLLWNGESRERYAILD